MNVNCAVLSIDIGITTTSCHPGIMLTKDSASVDQKLVWYEQALRQVLGTAREHYDEVRLHVCSDHGMATVHTTVDLMAKVEALPFENGTDYTAVYDSTMARFWFQSESARAAIGRGQAP